MFDHNYVRFAGFPPRGVKKRVVCIDRVRVGIPPKGVRGFPAHLGWSNTLRTIYRYLEVVINTHTLSNLGLVSGDITVTDGIPLMCYWILKGALYWIHCQNSALVSWPIRHMTYTNRSPLLVAYTVTQNIVPEVEHEIKVSIQRTLGYITLGQAPPSLMLILAAREIHYIPPLSIC